MGVAKSSIKAVEHFKRAADKGESAALYNLGLLYFKQQQSQELKAKGLQFLLDAAKQEHTGALNFLAMAYLHGEGVPKNVPQGQDFLMRAVKLVQLGRHISEKVSYAKLVFQN